VEASWLRLSRPPVAARAVAVLLHGGTVTGAEPPRPNGLAALRMRTFEQTLLRRGAQHGLVVGTVRYRHRGWRAGGQIDDAFGAVNVAATRYPGVPIMLVGHSLGARVALRCAAGPGVVGVVALAPWLPPDEPVAHLAGRDILIIHGDGDRVCDPAYSLAYARRAVTVARRLARFEVLRGEHTLLARGRVYHQLTRVFTLATLGLAAADSRITDAFALGPAERCRIAA
jgi:pimeloyl-ACP methyl ester carboxylesterase